MIARYLALLAILAVACAGTARAQEKDDGFWGSIGAGYVAIGAGCDSCGTPTYRSGLAIYMRLGGTLTSGVGVGLQVASMTRDDHNTSTRLVVTTLIGQWHPYHSAGF